MKKPTLDDSYDWLLDGSEPLTLPDYQPLTVAELAEGLEPFFIALIKSEGKPALPEGKSDLFINESKKER